MKSKKSKEFSKLIKKFIDYAETQKELAEQRADDSKDGNFKYESTERSYTDVTFGKSLAFEEVLKYLTGQLGAFE